MSYILTVEPHRESWSREFEIEAVRIREAFGTALNAFHHIGSTAIPGIYAKPIIDILADVTSLDALDQCARGVEALGYESLGEFGISGRRYFRKNDGNGVRTHQIHAFANGSPHLERHLVFRDYLRAHPDTAREYCELKRSLVRSCNGDVETYMDGKDGFIKRVEREAMRWMGEGN